ncbi:DUF4136 domain-containing protein [Pontiella sulfatireligans]|uniref:DUF4136 domain-containing protein n=1 Tax=Pontiella sulfatireligans TaxID=2750658 RepID=A0A6C2UL24_9BACT|nr:DUF4136 domain-containing protein [Pontiella sulfatireligans]VGO20593.1 hypothetical protein SCARR_02658 [Pontiella sulfatireligans]
MIKSITQWICAAALAGLATSCVGIKVESWKNPEVGERPMGKTMVLAMAQSDSLCRQYESMFCMDLQKLGAEARSLHALVQDAGKLDEEQLVSLLRENGFDSILVTRLMSEDQQRGIGASNSFPTYYASYWGYYSTVYVSSYGGNQGDIYQEYRLETNLYDVKTRSLIWSGRNVVYDDRSSESNMRGIISAAVYDLKDNGLLQKK